MPQNTDSQMELFIAVSGNTTRGTEEAPKSGWTVRDSKDNGITTNQRKESFSIRMGAYIPEASNEDNRMDTES